ncbi:hypothetical protein VY88_02805 [Azospirillum thiophilum]|uniref:Uncharacterized protein n=1 Tax=Azospirillum thiophilum TaxID=528244 RepID=A0AAC9EXG2_9PROT|nr:hypothetical protein AL072_09905 [Azospirillum thiophilum]KJR65174.1 hypothetical protein VY88_02805 [Azospirillum thiophilum]
MRFFYFIVAHDDFRILEIDQKIRVSIRKMRIQGSRQACFDIPECVWRSLLPIRVVPEAGFPDKPVHVARLLLF